MLNEFNTSGKKNKNALHEPGSNLHETAFKINLFGK